MPGELIANAQGDLTERETSTDNSAAQVDLLGSIHELIRQLQRPAVAKENELWTSQDIAAYLKLSAYTVERRVVVQPGFPASVQPCATGAKAAKRWFAGEVITWLRQHRARLPASRRARQSA